MPGQAAAREFATDPQVRFMADIENAHRSVDRVPVNQRGAIYFGNRSEFYA